MNMPGIQMSLAQGAGGHSLNLLPVWTATAWTAIFLVIAASHLRNMSKTTGQRRPWHACHVLMALGMAFMYAPMEINPLAVPSTFWKLVFAAAGLIAAVWAIGGGGRVSILIWLLSSIDLCAMIYMASGTAHTSTAPVTWLLTAYVLGEAVMWSLDLYRRIDGMTPIISWRLLAIESGAAIPAASISTEATGRGSLLGELDISASMIAMALGMAYMLVAMQLMA
jgi:hypothetical protein